MGKITIAIDGYSSCGKSTIAKQVAGKIGYNYVDSGAMYRAVTYYLMKEGLLKDKTILHQQILDALPLIRISFKFNAKKGVSETFLNDENVEQAIRSIEVSRNVSQISAIEEVRHKLVEMQQQMGTDGGVVMDGRDIGTVVFPNADVKLFMTADLDIRAERRLKEMQAKDPNVNLDDVRNNLKQRDYIDMNRAVSPLVQAEDAIIIDNSFLSEEEQFDKVMAIINQKIVE